MLDLQTVRGVAHARALVVSLRGVRRELSRCLTFEFEDRVAEMDAVDLVTIPRSLAPPEWLLRGYRAVDKLTGGAVRLPRAGYRPRRDYDLLFVAYQDLADLDHLGRLDALLARCRTSICYVEELWCDQIRVRTGEIDGLRQFDRIAVGCRMSVEPLQAAVGKPCFYLPPGTDAIAFHPRGGLHAPRPVDIYWMGRRSPRTHAALLDLAERHGLFYLHDTYTPGPVHDPAAHRRLLASVIQRSKLFFANKAKADLSDQTGGQEEVGFRFFEGAAGGAVMVGDAPHESPAFDELFGWPDAVVQVPFGSADVAATIEPLLADPDRQERVRAANLETSLRHHDWAHRWAMVLEVAGLAPRDELDARRARLHEMADRVRAQRRVPTGSAT